MMRWILFNFNHYDDSESDIIGLTYKGYTAPDSAQSTEPNSLASIDQPDSSLRTTSKHSNKLHHSTANSLNNNNNHNSSNSNSNSIGGTTSKSNSSNGNNNNNNNHVRYSNAIPAINTMSSKTSSKSTSGSAAHQYSSLTNHSSTSSAAMASITSSAASYETTVRKSPEGKDNDSYHIEDTKNRMSANNNLTKHNNNGQLASATSAVVGSNGTTVGHQKIGNDISTEIFSASNDNGKINVQVTVLVDTQNLDQSHAGTTLANLKKQRAQSRNSGTSENGSLMSGAPQSISSSIIGTGNGGAAGTSSGVQSMEMSLLSSANELSESAAPTITKFSGVTSDVVSDSTRSRRCCVVM